MALCLLVGALGFTVRNQCTFLSPNDRVGGDLLVMEGWVPDHVVRAAIDEVHRGGYRQLLVTGGGIERGRSGCSRRDGIGGESHHGGGEDGEQGAKQAFHGAGWLKGNGHDQADAPTGRTLRGTC